MDSRARAVLPGLLSGLLLGVTTVGHGPFYHVHWAIFFGFVPLWTYWLEETRVRRILLSGWICQLTFTLCAFHWIAFTVNEFSHLGLPVSVLVMLGYCAVANLQFPAAGWLWHRFLRPRLASPFASVAALAVLTAAAQRLGTMIFHWNFGYAWLYMGWPGAQLAEWFGFRFLCTFSIAMNGLLLLAWRGRKRRAWRWPLGAALGAFAAVNAAGAWLLHRLPPPDATVKVLLIQPNIGNREKERLDHEKDFHAVALQRYFDLTDRALAAVKDAPDFAIWPENAFPGFIADRELTFALSPTLRDYLRSRRLNLLTGSFGMNEKFQTTNALFALTKDGRWGSPPYFKMLLLPFGEYVPGAETFPRLKSLFPDVRDYGRGPAPVLLELAGRRLGPQICYEGLFDFIARDTARLGAQLLVNITNDSWYGTWMEPWQHFYITMAKAVETRRPLIRDTNTGISAVADARGEITPLSPVGEEWFRLFEVRYRTDPPDTLFMGWGYYFDGGVLCAALAALALCARRRPTPAPSP